MESDDKFERIVYYHERTKHRYNRYANGPGYLDWANQPDPFRRFEGAPLVYLPAIDRDESPPYSLLMQPGAVEPAPVTAHSVSCFFEMALAISAWKQAGDSRWALRSNPSSGNLHPTEGYLAIYGVEGIYSQPGVYHYAPKEHGLERRTEFSREVWDELMREFPPGAFLLGLSSIHWREAWKYGERAFRYCQHDIGHALAACRIAAAALGWNLVMLEGLDDADIAALLGLSRDADFRDADREHPDLVAAVSAGKLDVPPALPREAISKILIGGWRGKANRLSDNMAPWEIIDAVAEATVKTTREYSLSGAVASRGTPIIEPSPSIRRQRTTARQIVRQRRSAVSFDGVTHVKADEFYSILSQTQVVMSAVSWSPRVHLCLFVHRVDGLQPGLYFFARDPLKIISLRGEMSKDFLWRSPAGCPDSLNLFLLKEGNFRRIAAQLSCTQEIAGDSAFSLGMIAEFAPALREFGTWFYRRLFWESGMVGQMLYLAAEYIGVRGTGIGCYFDDAMHELLGVSGQTLQSLYHFTIGGPLDDSRLSMHPAYAWSCEIPSGRFPSRAGYVSSASDNPFSLPETSVCAWKGQYLARIGVSLRGFSRGREAGDSILGDLVQGPINVFALSPDETDGADEILLGDVLNAQAETAGQGAELLFLIVRAGFVRGGNARFVEAMEKRGEPFYDVLPLQSGLRFCLHPDFLERQLNRSLHRLGVGAVDLFLARVPEKLSELVGEVESCRIVRQAAEYLQKECDRGRSQGFGFSHAGGDGYALLEKVVLQNAGLPGLRAVELRANFVERRAFERDGSGTSFFERVRERGLLAIVCSPLRAAIDGNEYLLADDPELDKLDLSDMKNRLLAEAGDVEMRIAAVVLRDGRTIAELLRQANFPSPFALRSLISPFCGADSEAAPLERMADDPPSADDPLSDDVFQNALFLARTFGDQLLRAGLLGSSQMREITSMCETTFARARLSISSVERRTHPRAVLKLKLRETYFPGSVQPLQVLGLKWLLDQGADIILNGMSCSAYAEQALTILRRGNGVE